MWLLDTNTIIKIPKPIWEKFSPEKIKCSYITILEHPIQQKYSKIEIIYPDEEIWMLCLKLAIKLRNIGKIIPIADLIIASTAIICQLDLVTDDHHFNYVKSIDLSLSILSQQEFEQIQSNKLG